MSVGSITSLGRQVGHWLAPDHPDNILVTDPRVRIFLVAFTILFFELLAIRWIPSYVRYLGYFNNFVLLASFLGIGLGMLAARRSRFWFPPFPIMLLVLVLVVAFNRFEFAISSTDVLYYGLGEAESAEAENFIVLPVIIGLVAATFIPLCRPLGILFTQVRPLTAYFCDIVGSLAGIAAFFAIAYFSFPPVVWFGTLAVMVGVLHARRMVVLALVPALISLGIAFGLQQGSHWSPYYRIQLHEAEPTGYIVDVNNAGGHQSMIPWEEKEPFYRRVYEIFPGESFQNVLILGSGSGSDVATALAYGVPSITAVEIDPKIHELGERHHPDEPFSDPRVNSIINDGRAYLHNTDQTYDLILFALPDSLTLTSGVANLRLESFLLTRQAIEAAHGRLADDGLLVMYNYYREDWFIEKLTGMVGSVFDQDPLVSTYGGWGRAAVIMAGPRVEALPPDAFGPYVEDGRDTHELRVIGEGFFSIVDHLPATDDWPFIYLRDRTFPSIYVAALAVLAMLTLPSIAAITPTRSLRRFDFHMFFLGVAFAMLEVKALVTFALLFGTTWMVNSLVFFAILTSVLLAILVNAKFRLRQIWIFYVLLFGVLGINLALPLEALLFDNMLFRYVIASALTFAPVFFANVIFSNSFRDSEAADIAFASNLLGIMVGGALEYISMVTGHHLLIIPVMAFYFCAWLFRRWSTTVVLEEERSAPAQATQRA